MYSPSSCCSVAIRSSSRWNVNVSSVIVVTKCLATLCRLMTFPTRRPIAAAPCSGRFLRVVAAAIGARSSSVAASNSCRLRCRWAASRGLRHTISRSPGNSSLVTSARSRSSNNDGVTVPAASSLRIIGARSVVIQRRPSTPAKSLRMRAAVSMPRSPTSTTRCKPKRVRIFSTWQATVLGVGRRALEDLDRNRTTLGRAQQTEDDLQRALLAVAAVPALGQRAVGSLQVTGGQVVEHQRVFPQVPLGQTLLDGRLLLHEPVHRGVELMLIDGAEPEHLAQGGDGAVGRQGAGGGQLGLRIDDAGDDQGEDEVADAAGVSGDQRVQSELLEGAEHGGDVAVGQAADAGEGVFRVDEPLTAEDAAQHLDGVGRQLGEVGEGTLLDSSAVAVGLAQEHGWRRGAIGHAVDIHGYSVSHIRLSKHKT